ncbi:MAG: hypothetical protein ABJA98_28525 [Acidobacteriota bacterium]
MATLRQAIESHRERGTLPRASVVSVGDLHRRFPGSQGSTRRLILKMFEAISARKPWAIILCRFKGAAPHPSEPSVEALYRRMFMPGSGGLVEYWRDATLGNVDITGSRVFDWIEVDIPRDKAGGHPQSNPVGPGRSGLVDAAIRAVLAKNPRALDGFYSQMSVYNENWSSDDVPVAQQFAGSPFWIDGSADGSGRVNLTPTHAVDIVAHEMGHGFNMSHDVNVDSTVHYADPCCIMSQRPLFRPDGWPSLFGPAVCLPHLVQMNWMYRQRILVDNNWASIAGGINVRLAQVSDPGAEANLGAALPMFKGDDEWDYYLEYVRPTVWSRGLSGEFVFIRRIRPSDAGPTAAILGSIAVPAGGATSQFVEAIGNVRFEARHAAADGRVVNVNIRKL